MNVGGPIPGILPEREIGGVGESRSRGVEGSDEDEFIYNRYRKPKTQDPRPHHAILGALRDGLLHHSVEA
jgi:hypothetical protein